MSSTASLPAVSDTPKASPQNQPPLREGEAKTLNLLFQGLAKRCKNCTHVIKIQNLQNGLCPDCK